MRKPLSLSHAAAAALIVGAAPAAPAAVYFSEYVEGSSNNKAVEVVNTGSAAVDLSDYDVQIFFNGGTSPGATIALAGSLAAGGTYVLANSSASFAGTASQASGSLTFNGDDAVVLRAGGAAVDVIGQIGVDPGSYWGSAPTKTQDATLRRQASVSSGDADGSDAFDPAAQWVGLPIDTVDGLGCPGTEACASEPPAALTRIYEIQGAGHQSPKVGQRVTTRGIVTALRSSSGPGFYLQDPDGDGDPATSDAVFVYTASAPTVAVGDDLLVTGTVSEFRPGGNSENLTITQLGSPSISTPTDRLFNNTGVMATVLGAGGRAIPTQVIDDDTQGSVENPAQTTYDPENDGIDFMESIEAMLVRVDQAQAVSPRNSYGEVWVVANNGADATGMNDRGGITISESADGQVDQNPERLQLDDLLFGSMPAVNVGARAESVSGVVSYDFGNFEILPSVAPQFAASALVKESAQVARGGDRLSFANYNVENLDPNDEDPNPAASGCPDADIADGKFAAIASQIVDNLHSPDLLSLQEVQDNSGCVDDGVTSADVTLATLVAAIKAAGGPEYTAVDIAPVNDADGGLPGGNIRVAYLYNAARVQLVPGTQGAGGSLDATVPTLDEGQLALTLSPGRVDPTDAAWAATRKPLAAVWTFNGQRIVTINNHWSSKGGGTSLYGQKQPPVNGSEDQREAQAAVVNAFVDSVLAVDPQAKILVAGDLNEFSFEPPLAILRGDADGQVLYDLADELLPADERYSYNFDGNSQELDHTLVSASLRNVDPEIDLLHLNSEFTDQTSDHDPVAVSLQLVVQICDGGKVGFATKRYLAAESQALAAVSVTRSGANCGAASVSYAAASRSATAGDDFEPASGMLQWANGESGTKSFVVPLIDDALDERNELVSLSLSGASGASLGPAKATLQIRDNDRR